MTRFRTPSRHWIAVKKENRKHLQITAHFDRGTDPQYDGTQIAERQQRYWAINVMKQLELLMLLIDQAHKIRKGLSTQDSKQEVLIDDDVHVCIRTDTLTLTVNLEKNTFEITGEQWFDVDAFYDSLRARKLCYFIPAEIKQIKRSEPSDVSPYLQDDSLNPAGTTVMQKQHYRDHKTVVEFEYNGVLCCQNDEGPQTAKAATPQPKKFIQELKEIKQLQDEIDAAFEGGADIYEKIKHSSAAKKQQKINRKQTIKLNFFLWLYLRHEINKLKSSEQYSDFMQEAFNLFATQLREDAYDYRAAKDHVAPKLRLKNQKMFWQEKMMPAIQTAADNIQRKKATIAASAA